jgi:hypothetical protein
VDWGESGDERPDIAVLMPSVTIVEEKKGAETKAPSAYAWDYSSAIAVEVEMSPQKSQDQVKKNYSKNKGVYTFVRFVVTSENHKQQVEGILSEDREVDPAKYRVDVIAFESLNAIEPRPAEMTEEDLEKTQADETLSKLEAVIVTRIMSHGFASREDLVLKCSEVGIQVSPRSVSRCLKALTEKRLLQREGKSYVTTEEAKKLIR